MQNARKRAQDARAVADKAQPGDEKLTDEQLDAVIDQREDAAEADEAKVKALEAIMEYGAQVAKAQAEAQDEAQVEEAPAESTLAEPTPAVAEAPAQEQKANEGAVEEQPAPAVAEEPAQAIAEEKPAEAPAPVEEKPAEAPAPVEEKPMEEQPAVAEEKPTETPAVVRGENEHVTYSKPYEYETGGRLASNTSVLYDGEEIGLRVEVAKGMNGKDVHFVMSTPWKAGETIDGYTVDPVNEIRFADEASMVEFWERRGKMLKADRELAKTRDAEVEIGDARIARLSEEEFEDLIEGFDDARKVVMRKYKKMVKDKVPEVERDEDGTLEEGEYGPDLYLRLYDYYTGKATPTERDLGIFEELLCYLSDYADIELDMANDFEKASNSMMYAVLKKFSPQRAEYVHQNYIKHVFDGIADSHAYHDRQIEDGTFLDPAEGQTRFSKMTPEQREEFQKKIQGINDYYLRSYLSQYMSSYAQSPFRDEQAQMIRDEFTRREEAVRAEEEKQLKKELNKFKKDIKTRTDEELLKGLERAKGMKQTDLLKAQVDAVQKELKRRKVQFSVSEEVSKEEYKRVLAEVKEKLRWSDEFAENGEHFFVNEAGEMNLVTLSEDVFRAIGLPNMPFRLTPSMIAHVLYRHPKELKLTSPQDTVRAILDVMTSFDHVRKGREGTLVFSVEGPHTRSARRAITIVLEYDNGKWLGIKTTGYESIKDLKEAPILWEKGETGASTTAVAAANVSSEQSSRGDRTAGIASNQSKGDSEGKGNTLFSEQQALESESLLFGNMAVEEIRSETRKWTEATGVEVEVVEGVEGIADEGLRDQIQEQLDKGSSVAGVTYDGKVYIYAPGIRGAEHLEGTMIHEVVTHLGIKGLLGQKGRDRLMDRIWNDLMTQEERDKWIKYPGVKDKLDAAEEWLAHKSETMDVKGERSVWDKVKSWVRDLLGAMGWNTKLSDDALRDTLRKAYGQMVAEKKVARAEAISEARARFNLRQYEESGRDLLVKTLDKWADNPDRRVKISRAEADEIISQLDYAYDVCKAMTGEFESLAGWSVEEVRMETSYFYDSGKKRSKPVELPVFSVIKKNGDYTMNMDFSLLCKKRETLDAVLQALADEGVFDQTNLGQIDIARINDIIRKHGFETACSVCFVDARRFRIGDVAETFTELWNGLVDLPDAKLRRLKGMTNEQLQEYLYKNGVYKEKVIVPKDRSDKDSETVEKKVAAYLLKHPEAREKRKSEDFMTAKNFDFMRVKYPDVLKFYNMKKGTGGPKSSSQNQVYHNEILLAHWSWNPTNALKVGGVRLQSFSDFQGRMLFDYMQMLADLSARKLPVHAYTKEAIFAKLFGLTGMKINLSLVPKAVPGGVAPGLDANGDYAWQEGQSFPWDEAVALMTAKGYRDNCGTIAIGVSRPQIWKMLSDPLIRMIIPYHKSGLSKEVAKHNGIFGFDDFTEDQTTRRLDGSALSDEEKKKHHNFNEALRRLGSPRAAADDYLNWCKKHGFKPKFSEFAEHPNYYKLLEDFTSLVPDEEGNEYYTPHVGVKMILPTAENAFGDFPALAREAFAIDEEIYQRRKQQLEPMVDEIIEMFHSEGRLNAIVGEEKSGAEFSVGQERGRTEATRVANDAVMECLSRGGIEVERVTQEDALKKAESEGVNLLETPGGKVYGWAENGKIYLTEEGMDANTPIHEYTHLWVEAIKKSNPKGWASIVKVLKESSVWAEVMEDGAYEKIRGNEDAVASEVLSRLSGEKGRRMFEEQTRDGASESTVIDRVRRAVRSFWAWVGKNLFGIKKFKSVEEVTDRVLYDLTRGTKLEKGEKDRTLVGVHNISAEKILRAMKMGGLANPSVAVIDVMRQLHKGFGDISLIMPSENVENAYTGDAWTPMYPRVHYGFTREGLLKIKERIDSSSLADEYKQDAWQGIHSTSSYDARIDLDERGLQRLFLVENGYAVDGKDVTNMNDPKWYNLIHNSDGGYTKEILEWVAGLEKYGGMSEFIRDNSKAKLPHTIENASMVMRQKGKQGIGVGAPEASRAARLMKSKDEIRREEDRLVSERREVVNYDRNNDLEGEEYVRAVQNERPTKYFETKFERPVKFNEFAAAVVPEDTPADVVDFLRSQGLQIETYERDNDASRRAAMDRATQKEGVRFSIDNKKTPVADQPNRVNEKPVSGSVLQSCRGDSSSKRTAAKEAVTKIANRTQSAKKNLKNFHNGDQKVRSSEIEKTLTDLGRVFSMIKKGSSRYGLHVSEEQKTVEVRLSKHVADGDNFMKENADYNVSIVIEYDKREARDSALIYDEGVIQPEVYETKGEEVVAAIIKGVEDVLAGRPFTLPKEIGIVETKGGNKTPKTKNSRRGGFGSAMEELKLSEAERAEVRARAEEVAREMGIDGDVEFVDGTEEGLSREQKGAKAWFDSSTGKVTVNLANAEGTADVEMSLLHEGAGHKGLRAMFGERFKQFLGNVWDAMPEELRRRAFEGARKYGWDLHTGTEEVLSEMAEKGEFKKYDKFFNRLKGFFGAMLRASGLRSGELSNNELQYVLWQSYRGLQGKNKGLVAKAERIAMEHALGVGRFSKKNNPNRGESAGVESTWARFSLIFGLTRYSDSS